jgi:hypothetical protein
MASVLVILPYSFNLTLLRQLPFVWVAVDRMVVPS